MKTKTVGLMALLAVGLLALACTETTVLPSDRESSPGISVSGIGSVFGEPDVAILTLGVEAQADSVGEARAKAAEAMDAMLTVLKDGGVEDSDIQTSRFSVEPRYNFRDGEQELIGFFVNNLVTVKIRDIDETGTLIDDVVEAGGDLTRVQNLRFTIDDPEELQQEARRLAMENAKSKAETLADAGGVELGAPRSISESSASRAFAFLADASQLSSPLTQAPRLR
ncbi:MAG: SIMPL domain-containing protein [Chloroflexi bacterium]|nr:SIMPL domain-containing protein [Chloroflexota bacterium]